MTESTQTVRVAHEAVVDSSVRHDIYFIASITTLVVAVVGILALVHSQGARDATSVQAVEPELSFVEHGQRLYQLRGCVRCHGESGAGGVPNPNTARSTIPALNGLAGNMGLYEREDANQAIAWLEQHDATKQAPAAPALARPKLFLAQYRAISQLIEKGNAPAAKDPALPPPTAMPAWGGELRAEDIDAILGYLISLGSWEDELDEESTQTTNLVSPRIAPSGTVSGTSETGGFQ